MNITVYVITLIFRRLEGKRLLERPRHKLEDNIKNTSLHEIREWCELDSSGSE
jgi:hypothetical protein